MRILYYLPFLASPLFLLVYYGFYRLQYNTNNGFVLQSKLATSVPHGTFQAMQPHSHVQEVCRKYNFTGLVRHITGSRPLNATVCLVPKAGCTQWLRIFNYLDGQKRQTNNPLTITKYEAHFSYKHKRFNFSGKDQQFISNSFRVMTTRHPFTRLWSAYVDKLVLPDFWGIKGKKIIRMMRKNATLSSLRCGNDVSFKELVGYLLRIVEERRHIIIELDNHWLPVSDICDPCRFKPDLIQKQETLVHDFNISMTKLGQKELFQKLFATVSPAEYEIAEEIDYVYRVAHSHRKCASKMQFIQRIWKAFILNGYLPPNEQFPDAVSPEISKKALAKIVIDVRRKANMTSERTRHFRKLARDAAFSTLTPQQMAALKNVYRMDFLLFDYPDVFI